MDSVYKLFIERRVVMYEDRIKWIEHKGKRILSLDYKDFPVEELTMIHDEILKVISKEPPNSVAYLTNVEDFKFSMKILNQFNQFSKVTKPYDKGGAILGATGLVRVMYDGFAKFFGKPIKTCDTREEALEWIEKTLF